MLSISHVSKLGGKIEAETLHGGKNLLFPPWNYGWGNCPNQARSPDEDF